MTSCDVTTLDYWSQYDQFALIIIAKGVFKIFFQKRKQVHKIYAYIASVLNTAPSKTITCFLPSAPVPKHVSKHSIAFRPIGKVFPLHHDQWWMNTLSVRLFRFKVSPVQRYFFMNNLISCCRNQESQANFGGFT